jgi:YidC/Oxa1 family membrane protein insertase
LDKNTVTGLLLIFVLTIAWAWFTMPSQEEIERQQQEQIRQDSIAAAQVEQEQEAEPQEPVAQQEVDEPEQVSQPRRPSMGVFENAGISDTSKAVVRTSLYEIELTNVGAGPYKYTLLGHRTWDQELVQMIADTSQSAYSLEFLSFQNYNIETDQLVFEPLLIKTNFPFLMKIA